MFCVHESVLFLCNCKLLKKEKKIKTVKKIMKKNEKGKKTARLEISNQAHKSVICNNKKKFVSFLYT